MLVRKLSSISRNVARVSPPPSPAGLETLQSASQHRQAAIEAVKIAFAKTFCTEIYDPLTHTAVGAADVGCMFRHASSELTRFCPSVYVSAAVSSTCQFSSVSLTLAAPVVICYLCDSCLSSKRCGSLPKCAYHLNIAVPQLHLRTSHLPQLAACLPLTDCCLLHPGFGEAHCTAAHSHCVLMPSSFRWRRCLFVSLIGLHLTLTCYGLRNAEDKVRHKQIREPPFAQSRTL